MEDFNIEYCLTAASEKANKKWLVELPIRTSGNSPWKKITCTQLVSSASCNIKPTETLKTFGKHALQNMRATAVWLRFYDGSTINPKGEISKWTHDPDSDQTGWSSSLSKD